MRQITTLTPGASMNRRSFLVPVLLLLGVLSLACGSPDVETEERAAEICKGVTTENWYISAFGQRSPSEVCNQNTWIARGMVPCTLGNVPYLCRDNGSNMGVYHLSGENLLFLTPKDVAHLGDGLKFIR